MRQDQRENNDIPTDKSIPVRQQITRKEYEQLMRYRRAERERERKKRRNTIICITILVAAVLLIIYFTSRSGDESTKTPPLSAPLSDSNGVGASDSPIKTSEADTAAPLVIPDWIIVDILPVNEYSRPGDKLESVTGVVVHTTGNPGTTAEQNRSYYYNVSQTGEAYVSSHFVIGMDGTIIQCVPLDEIAYCSNSRNIDTISIECCHEKSDGKLSDEAFSSLVKLTKWLCESFELDTGDVIRHYDVTGKECPKYFTDHPDAWKAFLDELEK